MRPKAQALGQMIKRYLKHTFTLVVIFFLFLFVACDYIEQNYRYFESYDPTLHSGNWVPDIFPYDIKNIYEQHVIDTNEVWLRFDLGKEIFDPQKIGYGEIFPTRLNEITFRFPFTPIWRNKWWFEEHKSKTIIKELKFFIGQHLNSKAFIAINESEGKVYWWSL